jgi:hypothetical protein
MENSEHTINSIKEMLADKGKLPPANLWPDPILDSDTHRDDVDLTDGIDGPAFDFVRQLSLNKGYPVSCGMITALGLMGMLSASRKARVVAYPYNGCRYVTMYCVTGLPSGEGKSHFMRGAFGPFDKIVSGLEEKKSRKRNELFNKLNSIDEEIKILKSANKDKNIYSMTEYKDLMSDRDKVKEELDENKEVNWNANQSTMQEAARIAASQDGFLPAYSSEPDALRFITAETVGVKTSFYRNGFDGEPFNYATKQDGALKIPQVLAALTMMGQERVYERIVNSTWDPETGESVGEAERWICWTELGSDGQKRNKKYGPPPSQELEHVWRRIIFNMLNIPKESTFRISDDAISGLRETFFNYDDRCKPGDIFSTAPIKGFVHKCEAHIANIATALHIMKNFTGKSNESLSFDISDDTVLQAKKIFAKVVKNNLVELKRMGLAGIEARANEVKDALSGIVSKNKNYVLTNGKIQQGCAARAMFRKGKKLTAHEMYRDIYPALEKMNIIAVVGKTVYVNPKFA